MAKWHEMPLGIGLPQRTRRREQLDRAVTGFVIEQHKELMACGITDARAMELLTETFIIAAGKISGASVTDLAAFERVQINLASLLHDSGRDRFMRLNGFRPADVVQRRKARQSNTRLL